MNPFDRLAALAALRRREKCPAWVPVALIALIVLAGLWRARKGKRNG